MSSFELSIPYVELTSRQRHAYGFVLILAMIFSAIFYAHVIVLIEGHLPFLQNALMQIFYKIAIDILAVCILLPSVAGLYHLYGPDSEGALVLTSNGVNFPLLKGIGLLRGSFGWHEIAGISITTSNPDALSNADEIHLLTRNGKILSFRLNGISPQHQEKLFLALDTFAKQAQRDANYLQYQSSLQCRLQQVDGTTYTDLWEDELRRRFTSTNFVPLKPGSRIRNNSLLIERQLAFGGFAAIYLARDIKGQPFVLKELVLDDTAPERNKKALELLQREADLLCAIDHPQIVKVLDRFQEKGRNYLMLEHVEGNNLRQNVAANGPFDSSIVIELALQMVSMLEYLHSQKPAVIHRDFTPDNLLLRQDSRLVLVDFGAANQFLSEVTGTLVGKQNYMPPEQIRGKAVPPSDLFSLGGVLYFLPTGTDPLVLHTARPSDRSVKVPAALDNLICQLTKMEIAERPNLEAVKGTLQSMQTAVALPLME
ncbi:MAG: serine/threonine protein kinase [Candidatus Obscuribacter sp.]|nr:serine/threonine protein kinase [Candidatus Obscuribacter sp.]